MAKKKDDTKLVGGNQESAQVGGSQDVKKTEKDQNLEAPATLCLPAQEGKFVCNPEDDECKACQKDTPEAFNFCSEKTNAVKAEKKKKAEKKTGEKDKRDLFSNPSPVTVVTQLICEDPTRTVENVQKELENRGIAVLKENTIRQRFLDVKKIMSILESLGKIVKEETKEGK